MKKIIGLFLFTFLINFGAYAADKLEIIKPVMSCQQLGDVKFQQGIDAKVQTLKTEILKTPKGDFCKVSATLSPTIGVQVALPQTKWTQRMLQVGCGGLCGNINLSLANASGCVPAMNGELTVAATDMGHSGSMMDASWALDPQKRIDFAYRANHVTAQFTKQLIQAYYGRPQKYAYFMGCSDGGREALVEAQRFPKDFNGISAGAPAAYFSEQNSFYHGWNVVANLDKNGKPILLQNRLALLHKAALEHCPPLIKVGQNDIASTPLACSFSKNWVTQCKPNQRDKSRCFTSEEINVIEKLYHGATDNQGHQFVVGGLPIGSELRWPVPDTLTGSSMSEMMALPALQYVLLPGGKQDFKKVSDFSFDEKNYKKIAELAPLYNATNTNLNPFHQAGGKLILWHGLADDSISPVGTIAYYQGLESFMGKAQVEQFTRLFLLPSVAHCGSGDGPDQVDLLTALMRWVEQGQAPQKLIVGKREHSDTMMMPKMMPKDLPKGQKPPGLNASAQFHEIQKPSNPVASEKEKVTMTLPVYVYPYVAQYKGKGDTSDENSYEAVKFDYAHHLKLNKPISNMIAPNNQLDYHVKDGKLIGKKIN